MNIIVNQEGIVITTLTEFKPYQISQLKYYGFIEENGTLIFPSKDSLACLLKVKDFFETENITFDIDSFGLELIKSWKWHSEELKNLIEKADKIKAGLIDNQEFKSFKAFVNTLPRKLKPHQIKAAFHFYVLQNEANFSVPGSGKTSVVLSVFEKLKQEGKCNFLFVIGPPSCFQPWKNEYRETLGIEPHAIILSGKAKSHRIYEYYQPKKNIADLYLCTFHTASNDTEDLIKFLSQKELNPLLVIDEAHYFKQVGGSWANSILKLAPFANARCVLTGTPIPKSYKDLFNIFDFLWPNTQPLSVEDKIQIDLLEKKKENDKVKAILTEKISPLFYRVRKKDLKLKKQVFHMPILVKMKPLEKNIYQHLTSKILDLADGDYFKNEEIISALRKGRMMRMRQAVSYPKLLSSAITNYSEDLFEDSDLLKQIKKYDQYETPGKLDALISLVKKLRLSGQKVLIWSNFVNTLHLIKDHIKLTGENCELIYGKTPIRGDDSTEIRKEKTREDIRDEFVNVNSGLDILIANPAACSESISLHKSCFNAIYYDLSYNCAQYIQSLDRIHRVGGSEENTSNYYFLQYETSIDQDIKDNIEKKAKKMFDLIEQDYAIHDLNILDESEDEETEAYMRLFKQNPV